MATRRLAEWLVLIFFVSLIVIVFQQIATNMAEQGIASGGPYDNAAAYPQAIAIIIGVLLVAITALRLLVQRSSDAERQGIPWRAIAPAAALLAVFAIYLTALGWLGYHLATTPMMMAVMALAGYRRPLPMLAIALAISFGFAFFFEVFLKIVLPGGVFGLNIAW